MLLQHIGNVRGFAAFKNIRNKTELVKRVKYTVSRHLSLCKYVRRLNFALEKTERKVFSISLL